MSRQKPPTKLNWFRPPANGDGLVDDVLYLCAGRNLDGDWMYGVGYFDREAMEAGYDAIVEGGGMSWDLEDIDWMARLTTEGGQ